MATSIIKEKQSKLRRDLVAVNKIRHEVWQMSMGEICKQLGVKYSADMSFGGANSQYRTKLWHQRVRAELNLSYVTKAPALPPWFTYKRPKAKSEIVEKLKDDWYKKTCIDCGDIFTTCNKERACCDVCHDIRVAHNGYKQMVGVNDDGIVHIVNPKVTMRK